MTNPMQISPFARLTVDPYTYRNAVVTSSGCSFERTDLPNAQIFHTFEKLRELLRKPENYLEPDYYLVERHELRESGVVGAIGMLPDETKSEVLWRYAYVEIALQLERAGRLKRTEFSTRIMLVDIERCVNQQAGVAQGGWVPKRADGRRNFERRLAQELFWSGCAVTRKLGIRL
jgi:hypothetical protein